MRDIIFGAVILSWTYMAAHVGTGHVTGLFEMVNGSLGHILAQLG